MANKKRSSGLTLIEVILTIIFITLLAVVGLYFMVFVTQYSNVREDRMTAANLAYSAIEHLNEKARNNFADPAYLLAGGHPGSGNLLAPANIPAGYTVSYTVIYGYWAEDPGNKPTNTDDTSIDYKRISVTCTYPGGRSLAMTGYVVKP